MAITPLSYTDVGTAAVDKINSAFQTLQSEIDSASAALTAEKQARISADQSQVSQITQNEAVREGEDANLQGQINQKSAEREAEDANLQNQITQNEAAREAEDANLQKQIYDNAAASQAEDASLQKQISAEVQDRQAGDAAEARARADAIASAVAQETGARADALRALADQQAAALTAEAQQRERSDAAEASQRQMADAAEAEARAEAITALKAELGAATASQTKSLAQAQSDTASAIATVSDRIAPLDDRMTATDAAVSGLQVNLGVLRQSLPLSSRPGDAPASFTGDLATLVSSLPANIAPASIATGRRLRITGAGVLAPVAFRAVEAGRLVKVRAVVRRYVDTLDPAGDAIGLFLAWYDSNRAMLPGQTRIAIALLTAARGPMQLGALVSPDIGDASTIRPPAGAAYLRPFVQTWGDTPVTDVEVIETTDVTDAGGVSVDLDAVVNRLASVEARQAAIPGQVRRRSFVRTMMYGG